MGRTSGASFEMMIDFHESKMVQPVLEVHSRSALQVFSRYGHGGKQHEGTVESGQVGASDSSDCVIYIQ